MSPFFRHTFLADMALMTFARKFLVGEILTALPTTMTHRLVYSAFKYDTEII